MMFACCKHVGLSHVSQNGLSLDHIIIIIIIIIIIHRTFCDISTNETFSFLTETYKLISFNLIVSMKEVSCVYCKRHLIGLTVTS